MTTKKAKLDIVRAILDRTVDHLSREDVQSLNCVTGWTAVSARKQKDRQIQITLPDGRCEVWSWRKAILGYSHATNVTQALQAAIAPQKAEFVRQSEKVCVFCGATSDLTADHKDIPFKDIAASFAGDTRIRNSCTGTGWELEDPTEWLDHHNSRVTYQVLCRPCNSLKGATTSTASA